MKIRKMLLSIYLLAVFLFGVLCVPVTEKWGPDLKVDTKKFVPLWQIVDHHKTIDNFIPVYEIDYLRVLYTIGVSTLLIYVALQIIKGSSRSQ